MDKEAEGIGDIDFSKGKGIFDQLLDLHSLHSSVQICQNLKYRQTLSLSKYINITEAICALSTSKISSFLFVSLFPFKVKCTRNLARTTVRDNPSRY